MYKYKNSKDRLRSQIRTGLLILLIYTLSIGVVFFAVGCQSHIPSRSHEAFQAEWIEPVDNYYVLVECRKQYFWVDFDGGERLQVGKFCAIKFSEGRVLGFIDGPVSFRYVHRSTFQNL